MEIESKKQYKRIKEAYVYQKTHPIKRVILYAMCPQNGYFLIEIVTCSLTKDRPHGTYCEPIFFKEMDWKKIEINGKENFMLELNLSKQIDFWAGIEYMIAIENKEANICEKNVLDQDEIDYPDEIEYPDDDKILEKLKDDKNTDDEEIDISDDTEEILLKCNTDGFYEVPNLIDDSSDDVYTTIKENLKENEIRIVGKIHKHQQKRMNCESCFTKGKVIATGQNKIIWLEIPLEMN